MGDHGRAEVRLGSAEFDIAIRENHDETAGSENGVGSCSSDRSEIHDVEGKHDEAIDWNNLPTAPKLRQPFLGAS